MLDRCQNIDVDAACAQLRKLLADIRGLGRRDFIRALGQALAGSAILSLLPRLTADAEAAEQPVTAFVFGGVWKKSAMAAFGEPFTKKTGIPVARSRSCARCTRPRPCRSMWCRCRAGKCSR